MKMTSFPQNGQMLIEVVMAVLVISLVLLGTSDLISRSLSSSTFQKNNDIATTLITEKLNYYKRVRDADQSSFFNDNSILASDEPCSWVSANSKFACTQTITRPTSNYIEITITASWVDGNSFNKTLTMALSKTDK